jgi:hypothetical protein
MILGYRAPRCGFTASITVDTGTRRSLAIDRHDAPACRNRMASSPRNARRGPPDTFAGSLGRVHAEEGPLLDEFQFEFGHARQQVQDEAGCRRRIAPGRDSLGDGDEPDADGLELIQHPLQVQDTAPGSIQLVDDHSRLNARRPSGASTQHLRTLRTRRRDPHNIGESSVNGPGLRDRESGTRS